MSELSKTLPEKSTHIRLRDVRGGLFKRDHLINRLGFLEGAIEVIKLYAVWRNGEQLVGQGILLPEALRPYEEELDRLLSEVEQT